MNTITKQKYKIKGQQYGQVISRELADHLMKYTDKHDRAEIATQTGVGVATITRVVLRASTITRNSEAAIVELVKKAAKNCYEARIHAEQTREELSKTLVPV